MFPTAYATYQIEQFPGSMSIEYRSYTFALDRYLTSISKPLLFEIYCGGSFSYVCINTWTYPGPESKDPLIDIDPKAFATWALSIAV